MLDERTSSITYDLEGIAFYFDLVLKFSFSNFYFILFIFIFFTLNMPPALQTNRKKDIGRCGMSANETTLHTSNIFFK